MKRASFLSVLMIVVFSGFGVWGEKPSAGYKFRGLGKMSMQDAKSFFVEREQLVLSQFEPQFDPYTGYDSVPEKCQVKNLPKSLDGKIGENPAHLLRVYSSKDETIGDCTEESELLKVDYLMVFCKSSGQVYVGKSFYKNTEPWRKKLPQKLSVCD